MLRIVRVNGLILVYVWAMEQKENTFNTQVKVFLCAFKCV